MKTNFFLVSFLVFISIEVNAQSDSLTVNDSLPDLTVTIPDSVTIIGWGPWSYDRFQIDWSKFSFVIPVFESPYTPKGAKKDIKSGKPVILFHGGLGGMPDFSSEADKNFQRKYGVEFFCQGCSRMPNDDQEGYNQVIFDYLDRMFGKEWRYELPDGAVAFAKPIKSIIRLPESISELNSPLAMQLANPEGTDSKSLNPETETSVWWYILPTSGFALLLSFFMLINRRKKK